MPEIIPIEKLKDLLVDFNKYREGAGLNFDDKNFVTQIWKTDPLIIDATKELKRILDELKDVAKKILYHTKRLDPMKYLDNMTAENEEVAKITVVSMLRKSWTSNVGLVCLIL